MKIAVLTSGLLPVPAVLGGAVENLIDFYLEYNNKHKMHQITVYSISNPATKIHSALKSNVNHYYYIDTNSLWARIKRKIYYYTHGEEYNHYFIEYFLEQAIKDIRKQDYDCIILENRPSYALKLERVTKAKLVYHLHNEKLTNQTPQFLDIYQAASLIINVSNYITDRVKTINTDDTKCITIHNGIDIEAFSGKHSILLRQDIGFTNEDFVIIYSGRLNPEKGIKELIEAMNLLTDYPRIKLLIMGSSFFGDVSSEDDFIQELRYCCQGIKDRIHFTGYIPYKDVPSYLKIADLAVVPSMWDEPFGLTVLEAMAAGVPLITTNSGGIPEICKGVSCIVNRSNIVEELSERIISLYKNPELRAMLSSQSLDRAQNFSKEQYAERFFNALEFLSAPEPQS